MAATQSWFAPYVDVTATPKYAFEDLTASGHRSAVLAFVVSGGNAPCEPSWGGAYSWRAPGMRSSSTAGSLGCASSAGT